MVNDIELIFRMRFNVINSQLKNDNQPISLTHFKMSLFKRVNIKN